jgi:hypothetical protein
LHCHEAVSQACAYYRVIAAPSSSGLRSRLPDKTCALPRPHRESGKSETRRP